MSTGKILLGVLGGVAAGALIGILFAPDKGSKTRKRILEKGEDYANDLKDKFGGYYESIADKFDTVLKSGEELAEKGKSKYETAKK